MLALVEIHMLVYKTWLETRARFLSGAILLASLVSFTVIGAPETIRAYAAAHPESAVTYGEYIWLQLHSGYAQAVWIFSALLLGSGGLPRERTMGTAGYTLSLPVRRFQVLLARTVVCVAELGILALIPAVILSGLSPLGGEHYPLNQSLLFSVTTVGGGLVFFGLGALLPQFFDGEYTAAAMSFAIVGAWFFVGEIPMLHWMNVFDLMSGAGYLNTHTLLFESRFPWLPLLMSTAAALAMLATTALLTETQDF